MEKIKPITLIIVLFAVLAFTWSVLIPPFETPDESGHYGYVRFILMNSSLPNPPYPWNEGGSLYHPPLYYLLLSPVLKITGSGNYDTGLRSNPKWVDDRFQVANAFIGSAQESVFSTNPNIRAVYVLRIISVIIAIFTVILTYKIANIVFPNKPILTSASTILVSFNPQFIFHSASITNDNLATLLTTGVIYLLILSAKGKKITTKSAFSIGFLIGLAVVTKLNMLFLLALAVFYLLVHYKKRFLELFNAGFFLFGGVLVSGGWYFYKNIIRYGEPFGVSAQTEMFSIFANQNTGYHLLNDILLFFIASFQTYWGVFGWYNIYMPNIYFLVILLIVLASSWGVLNYLRQNMNTLFTKTFNKQLVILILSVLILWGSMLATFLKYPVVSNGRFLFPTIAPFAILMVFGLKNYPIKLDFRKMHINIIAVFGFLINLFILFTLILPKYH